MNKPFSTGVVIGKFMPPHLGHEYLFNFASLYCDELYILVDNFFGQTLSTSIRIDIIKKLMPNVHVLTFANFMPQDPTTDKFWDIWKHGIESTVGKQINVLIAAMDYGTQLSNVLNCTFIPIDIERNSIPISATMIRENPFKYWDFLTSPAKELYVKRIAVLGAESVCKTTAVKKLAKEFNTIFVPEYAESVIARQGEFYPSNVSEFVQGQYNSELALKKFANKLLFTDTTVVSTLVWADLCFGHYDTDLEFYVKDYDLVLVFDYKDTTWVYDEHRDFLDNETEITLCALREEYQEKLINKLNNFNIPFVLVEGDYDTKYTTTKSLVEKLFVGSV